MDELMKDRIFVLAFVHTEWIDGEKVYERRENREAFTDVIEAYKAAEHEAERMIYAYENNHFDVIDSEPTIGLVRYKNNYVRGAWNFYVDELRVF